jgi:hypothetical protein
VVVVEGGLFSFTRSCMKNRRVRKELGLVNKDAVLEDIQMRYDVLVHDIEGRDLTLAFMMLTFLLQLSMFNGLRPRIDRWRNSSKVEKYSLHQGNGTSANLASEMKG